MNTWIKRILGTTALAVSGLILFAQGATPQEMLPVTEHSPYKEGMFYLLVLIAALLLAYIFVLAKTLSTVARLYSKKEKEKSFFPHAEKTILLLLAFGAMPEMHAQNVAANFLKNGLGHSAYNALAIIILCELFVVLYYTRMINLFIKKQVEELPYVEKHVVPFWERFHKSVPIEKEAAILTDHHYDGIRELDNSLPPWWKYGFYLTIVFAVFYMSYYHVFGAGRLQLKELEVEYAEAQIQMDEYRKHASNLVDETNVTFLSGVDQLAGGQKVFMEKCAPCHGSQGGGTSGPNLTDQYWLHGGDVKDIFKTIKYGVPEKGMISWSNQLTASQMAEVTSFILSMQGTKPAGGRDPQGELYQPVAKSDTTLVPTDTLQQAEQGSLAQ